MYCWTGGIKIRKPKFLITIIVNLKISTKDQSTAARFLSNNRINRAVR